MTACCWRLTQPDTSSRTKASGDRSGAMTEACLRGGPGSRAAGLGSRGPYDWAGAPEAKAFSGGIDTPFPGSGVGRVFAPDRITKNVRQRELTHLRICANVG